jgi:recombination protein RecT
VGYYRLVNGAEKTIYMTVKQIENHEKRQRKGQYMTKNWRNDFDAMARKTVYRRLIGKWGVMSIEYQNSKDGYNLAEQMKEEYIDNGSTEEPFVIEVDVDETTGEVGNDEN